MSGGRPSAIGGEDGPRNSPTPEHLRLLQIVADGAPTGINELDLVAGTAELDDGERIALLADLLGWGHLERVEVTIGFTEAPMPSEVTTVYRCTPTGRARLQR